jgi:hypothetical protein
VCNFCWHRDEAEFLVIAGTGTSYQFLNSSADDVKILRDLALKVYIHMTNKTKDNM